MEIFRNSSYQGKSLVAKVLVAKDTTLVAKDMILVAKDTNLVAKDRILVDY